MKFDSEENRANSLGGFEQASLEPFDRAIDAVGHGNVVGWPMSQVNVFCIDTSPQTILRTVGPS